MGIGKRELLEDYYHDEIPLLLEVWREDILPLKIAAVGGIPKEREKATEEVYADDFFK